MRLGRQRSDAVSGADEAASRRAARALARAPVRVTVVDKRNHDVFQPLLYQVATAALNPSNIATPIRRILRGQSNASVILAEAVRIDTKARGVFLSDGSPITAF